MLAFTYEYIYIYICMYIYDREQGTGSAKLQDVLVLIGLGMSTNATRVFAWWDQSATYTLEGIEVLTVYSRYLFFPICF